MSQVCTVCKHPQRAEIDRSLVEGVPLRNIAEQHGTTPTSLHRHTKHLPVELTKAKEAREVADARTPLARVGVLIARLEGLATKAEDGGQWQAASGALREVGRCLRLLGELSGELGSSGTTINVSLHLQRSLSVVLGLRPEEFTQFWGTILKQATEAQMHALLSAEETQDALCVNPLFDSRFNDEAVEEAARKTLTEEERAALERINAKLQHFRDQHRAVKAGTGRIVLDEVEMAL